MIRMPSVCRASRQPNAATSRADRSGTSVPPMPMPRYANPIAFPRRAVEPPREQDLIRQRSPAHVAQRVEQVEEVERRERRHVRQSDERAAGHHNARHHQTTRAEPIDDPSRQEPEHRPDHQLAQRVAGGDLRSGPAELPHHEVVVERQPVQREPDDGEERDERGKGDLPGMTGACLGRFGHVIVARARRACRARGAPQRTRGAPSPRSG